MASDIPKVVPLTCHGHSRPVPHINFSSTVEDDQYYLLSACKDNNPMLRDGITGDWIGTFLGHKGAVWQARLSTDATIAATAAADFSAKVWDTHTGECLHTLQHSHICRAVAFPLQPSPQVVATGGFEKKLRIFDLTQGSNTSSPINATSGENGANAAQTPPATSYEIGPGVHGGTIKSIVWNQDYNILTTAAEDRKIRWWDLRSRHPVVEYAVEGAIGSCELNTLAIRPNDPGILTIAAGKSVYLFDGSTPGRLLKKSDFRYEVASAAVNNESGKLVTGSAGDTWARVYDLRTDEELGMDLLSSPSCLMT
ncbi:hypothetical protein EYZ11_010239 [Aspergillus tanneri]|uniref:Serine-threonine kinase receptor-associated protein n=1 Tax=Aspergillus tanneri TaxID=1220188 RepID=A0A4V3UN90_9EURO|nr:uncharacterized protein ATNIH1004_010824 [Aspergillus tanneri]KAA8641885.1 hypothetical protein ATNIH1004_010824 [Aspergillus tanneri]THC90304.1 hypothetical protein EYZ11_010239 [Aspergillus tanneri]